MRITHSYILLHVEKYEADVIIQKNLSNKNNTFPQGGPGHLYLLKNKVATFAKVEKEDDMIQ